MKALDVWHECTKNITAFGSVIRHLTLGVSIAFSNHPSSCSHTSVPDGTVFQSSAAIGYKTSLSKCQSLKLQANPTTRCQSRNKRCMTVPPERKKKRNKMVSGDLDGVPTCSLTTSQTALPYKWNQDLNTATVTVNLPSGTRARDLVVAIKKKSLRVRQLGERSEALADREAA